MDLPGRLRPGAVRAGVLRRRRRARVAGRARREPPRTRWELAGEGNRGYGEKFGRLVASGEDVDGEARLADVLAGRGPGSCDVGSGMGRVAAALVARGHEVVAVEPDPALVAQSARPTPTSRSSTPTSSPRPSRAPSTWSSPSATSMVFLAEDTERAVLARLRSVLAPGGRVLVGFHPLDGPVIGAGLPAEEFATDAAASGLRSRRASAPTSCTRRRRSTRVAARPRRRPDDRTSFGHALGPG